MTESCHDNGRQHKCSGYESELCLRCFGSDAGVNSLPFLPLAFHGYCSVRKLFHEFLHIMGE